ncbi:MAG TPA: hypothetical protein VHH72_11280 [Solirubrobacterales bacterium]|jgi:hypothetical protein|nr:hypothetical protein [Solirubrobacterales bacterium]
MTWVVFALVTVAVIAFFLYLFVFRFRRLARLGRIEVPGDTVIELPAGRVLVYYEDAFRWRPSQKPEPWAGFSMLVSDERSGARIDLGPPHSEVAYKSSGKNRVPYGVLDLPHAGRYRIVSQVEPDAQSPHITFA